MSEPRITFATLRDRLAELGFHQVELSKEHVGFERGAPDTLIALPRYKDREIVAARHMAATRIMLSNQGVMPAEEFDEWIVSSNVKHPAS